MNGKPIPIAVISFHTVMAALVTAYILYLMVVLSYTLVAPSEPRGWADMDYDALQGSRQTLAQYMRAKNLPDTTRMNSFSVATAGFGGIFTEDIDWVNPWIGSVSPEAARLQVEAGARAMVLDVWPDPSDRTPIVCSMLDTHEWLMQSIWMKWGLNKGVGRYSNWKRLTRNKAPVAAILKSTLKAAFQSSPGTQNEDPFFLIFKLHGGMSQEYMNGLGDIVRSAIGGHAMSTEWNKCMNQNSIGTAPVSAFKSKVFIIVVPDIQTSQTHTAFVTKFLTTRMGEVTNSVERAPNTIFFEPSGIGAIAAPNQTNCENPAGPPQTLSRTAFTVVQPTTGGSSTDNATLFGSAASSYDACIAAGAHFVAVNLFSQNTSDGPLTTFFSDSYFGKYSFRKLE